MKLGNHLPPLKEERLKSLMLFWRVLAEELASWCCTSTIRDYDTVTERCEHEGVSFLTITLPGYGKDLEKGLDRGFVDHDLFTGFRFKGGLPLFLGGFLDRVFDRSSGMLLADPCTDSIFALRQLTLLFGKIHLECSEERKRGAVQKFVQCEQEVREADNALDPGRLAEFRAMSVVLFGDILAELDRKVYAGEVVPKHGPGKTADRITGNRKYDQTAWTQRLESVFPFGDYAIPNWRYYYLLDRVTILEPGAELPVKVTLVPKTLKTPRIIAIEPTCMQYMQQSLMEPFVEWLESETLPSGSRNWIHGLIGFTDQVPNQHLACEGSLTGGLATLDLSEASDRVSNEHVMALLHRFPHLSEAVQATRSTTARVPGEGIIPLAKFASMGSALCFPIEAMVFLTLVALGIQDALNTPLTAQKLQKLAGGGKVRVYGDDIIVPTDYVRHVIERLESFGLKVNVDKSFWNGKFRESCGKEFYDGTSVSVTRVRQCFPARHADVQEIVSTVSLRNQLYAGGLWCTARYLDDLLGGLLAHYPTIHPSSPLLGRHTVFPFGTHSHGSIPIESLDADTHAPKVRGYVVKSKPPKSKLSGEGALLKWFLKRGDQPFADRDHMERQGRPRSVNIRLGRAQPF